MSKLVLTSAALALALLAPPALAEDGKETPPPDDQLVVKGERNDPGRVKCVVEGETGSRLARRRVCRTVAEWKAQRARDKMEIERSQGARLPDTH